MSDIGCVLEVSSLRDDTFPGEGNVVLCTTLKRRLIAQDSTVVCEQDIRLPTVHNVSYRLPLSFTGLEESLLQYLALVVERPDLVPHLAASVLSCIGDEVGATPDDLITKEFRVCVDVDLYKEEEAEDEYTEEDQEDEELVALSV